MVSSCSWTAKPIDPLKLQREVMMEQYKEKANKDKKVYGVFKEMNDMDHPAEQKEAFKNIFFSNQPVAVEARPTLGGNVARIGRQTVLNHKSVVQSKPNGKSVLAMGSPMFKRPVEAKKAESIAQETSFTFERSKTLLKIKEKATILKNVHDAPVEGGAPSEEESVIFKRVTNMLEKHLSSQDNPFKQLLTDFQVYLLTKYQTDPIDPDLLDTLCDEVLEFINLITKTLILFYNFDVCYFRLEKGAYLPCGILNFENLVNFVTAVMFPSRVYSLVLDYFIEHNIEKNKLMMHAMNNIRVDIHELGVAEAFKLNSIQEESMSPTSQLGDDTLTPMSNRSESRANNSTYEEDLLDEPYRNAIRTLRYISDVESPLEKMQVLLMTIRKIHKAINEHYKYNKRKQQVLTGEDTMSLVVYVVHRSKCPNLMASIEYVDRFLPKRMFNTFAGYYLTVFQAACEYVAGLANNNSNKQLSE